MYLYTVMCPAFIRTIHMNYFSMKMFGWIYYVHD